MEAYARLLEKVKELTLLQTTMGILNWDMMTYIPPKAMQLRGEQLSTISRFAYRLQTGTEFGNLLSKAEKELDNSDQVASRNLHLLRRNYDRVTKLPEDLVAEITKQSVRTRQAWTKAKTSSEWKIFEPELKTLFDLVLKRAELLMEIKGVDTLYDVVLDDFEPMMTSKSVTSAISELRSGLVPLVKKLSEISSSIDMTPLKSNVPKEIQKKILTDISDIIGFDTTSDTAGGRIDETHHPFTAGYFDDVRITVRYNEEDPLSAVFTLMHEAGHGIYEQSFRPEWMFQPVGTMASLGIHESISRFYENMIGRSQAFWEYYLPRFNEISGGTFKDITIEDLLRMVNRVTPSKIRIAADEVTYSLHVIIRFEIEQDLFNGDLTVPELPQAWNEKYREYLGVEVENDVEGALQDSHWADGMFGYFPTYALGNLYGGMWYERLSADEPDWVENLRQGQISSVYNWLKENVMVKSNLLNPSDLVSQVTGHDLTARPFLSYLEEKYSEIY